MEGHGGDETNKGAVAWQVLLPRKVDDVENMSDSIHKKIANSSREIYNSLVWRKQLSCNSDIHSWTVKEKSDVQS